MVNGDLLFCIISEIMHLLLLFIHPFDSLFLTAAKTNFYKSSNVNLVGFIKFQFINKCASNMCTLYLRMISIFH